MAVSGGPLSRLPTFVPVVALSIALASPAPATQKVTLSLLLDHTAGFTGGEFFPDYAVGEPVPSLVQVLDSVEPANNPPVRLGTLKSGAPVAGGWHVSPEMAAAGLWTTPTGLAKLAIGVARAAQRDAPGQVLSRSRAEDMLRAHAKDGVINILGSPDDPDAMGYGFFVGEKRRRFGHIGGHVGYQATLVFFGDTGDGAVILTNADHGLLAGNELLDAIAKHYQWNWVAPPLP